MHLIVQRNKTILTSLKDWIVGGDLIAAESNSGNLKPTCSGE